MLRIVHIGQFPLRKDCIRGGIEASIYGLAKTQSATCEIHVFDIPRIGGDGFVEDMEGVVVHRFSNLGGRQLSASRQVPLMANEIITLCPDVCHIHGTSLFAWRMYKSLKKQGASIAVTVHGLVIVEKRNALKKGFSLKKLFQYMYQSHVEKCFLSRLTMALVDTEYVKHRVNQYPIRKKPKIIVIPQGIDESFYRIKCSKDSKMILSLGAIGERKGHLLLLKAFERVIDEGVEAQLVIVGTVADKGYLKRLQDAIAQSKYRNSVCLLTDLTDKDLKQLFEKAHLFALHSEEESQGIVFAEAMATGLPIVGTNVGGVPFVVENGKNGLLSDYGDVNAFAKNIQWLMTDEVLWRTMSEASVRAADNYHWAEIGEIIIQLYKESELC